MEAISLRFNYLFRSTKGLVLVAICMIALTTAFFGLISGPMEEFGVKEFVIRITGMSIIEAEREGRIIMLYHSIAMAVVAIEVYFITNIVVWIFRPQSRLSWFVLIRSITHVPCGSSIGSCPLAMEEKVLSNR